ncbi:hypothetical protein IJZ97_02205 [bacterium]|nr:hypothetical protein [bacterium]
MKKVITKKSFLNTIVMFSAFCMLAPQVQANANIPQGVLDMLPGAYGSSGRSIKHDADNIMFEKQRKEVVSSYDSYQ